MGLDQWAYCRPPRKRNCDADEHPEEWRKHNRLQGWMEQLWKKKVVRFLRSPTRDFF